MKLAELIALLAERGIHLSPSRGQNFLVDGNLLQAMVKELQLRPGEPILEVGPGAGVLTRFMLDAGCEVYAIEFDAKLADYLESEFAANPRFHLLKADACKADIASFMQLPRDFRCISNLPYNISSVFLAQCLELVSPPSEMFLLLQREMADRLAADSSSKEYGSLTVRLGAAYDVKILRAVPPDVFFPRPNVQSAFIRLRRKSEIPSPEVMEVLSKVVRAAFSQRRKQMRKLVEPIFPAGVAAEVFNDLGISTTARAEELSIDTWLQVAGRLALRCRC